MVRKSTKVKRVFKKKTKIRSNKKPKKSCYKLSNPYHDVLIYNYLNNKSKMSNSDKKKLCKIIKAAINDGKKCLQEINNTTAKHSLNKFNC